MVPQLPLSIYLTSDHDFFFFSSSYLTRDGHQTARVKTGKVGPVGPVVRPTRMGTRVTAVLGLGLGINLRPPNPEE